MTTVHGVPDVWACDTVLYEHHMSEPIEVDSRGANAFIVNARYLSTTKATFQANTGAVSKGPRW